MDESPTLGSALKRAGFPAQRLRVLPLMSRIVGVNNLLARND